MFSPVDPNQLACAQVDGVFVVDIRKPKRFVIFFVIVNWKQLRLFWTVTWFIFFYLNSVFCTIYLPINELVMSSTVLMAAVCCVHQRNLKLFTTLAPTRNFQDQADGVSLSRSPSPHYHCYCFAGKEDELVVSAKDRTLFVWQLPSAGGRGQRTVDSPLLELSRHQNKIGAFCFNKNIGALASSDKNGVIKLWVPNEGN